MTRRFGTLVAVALTTAVVALQGAGAAEAGGKVVVSPDGRTWAGALTAPLFDPAERWVPGDARTARFYVGNRSGEVGTLALVARADDAEGLLARDDVRIDARAGHGAWTHVVADGAPHWLGRALAAGADTTIEVRALFTPTSPNTSQLRTLPLAFDVVLSAAHTDVSAPHPSQGSVLPDTGGVERWALVAGAVLAVLGATVVGITTLALGRDKDDDDDCEPI